MHAETSSTLPAPVVSTAWLRLAIGGVALLGFAAAGALALAGSPVIAVALIGSVTATLWLLLCMRRPDIAFVLTLFVWVLAYARLSLQVVEMSGPTTSSRGSLAIADLLWLGLAGGLLLRKATWRTNLRPLDMPYLWAIAPFLLASLALPMLGVVMGGWPVSFASPAVRLVQWVSFLPFAYLVARQYGAARLFRLIFLAIVAAGVLHAAYGMIQLAVSLGWLGPTWLALDDLYARNNEVDWFFFARVTGLLVNPNHYGLYAVFLLVSAVSWIIGGAERYRKLAWLALIAALIPIVLSGSRSAMVAAAGVVMFWGGIALAGDQAAVRLLRMVPALVAVAIVAFFAVWRVIPEALQNRYRRLLAVFVEGTGAEQNLTLRMDMWSDAWEAFLTTYPAGTWVAPSYALGIPIDSYFVFTAVQGTPMLTALWLVMMAALFLLGLSAYRRKRSAATATAGLILAGWTVTLLISSLTMSPLLQIQLSAPLWTMAGVVIAMRDDLRVSIAAMT